MLPEILLCDCMTTYKKNEFSGTSVGRISTLTVFGSRKNRILKGLGEAIFDRPNEERERKEKLAFALKTFGEALVSAKINPNFDMDSARGSLKASIRALTPRERERFDILLKKYAEKNDKLALEVSAVITA